MTPFEVSEKKYGIRFTQAYYAAKAVEKRTQSCESVYQWGGETGIYFYSKRNSVTGIIYVYPLFTGPEEDTRQKISKVYNDVLNSMPAIFVYNEAFGKVEQNMFHDFLQERYTLVDRISPYLIFEAKERQPCQADKSPGSR